jgi:hypothetical protein
MDRETPSRAEIDAEIKRSKSWDQIVTEGNKGAGTERGELAYLIGGFVVAGIIVMALFHTI